jgi:formylglycine-generating enzyme
MPQSEKGIHLDETNPAARPAPGNTHLMAIAIDAYAHCPRLSNCVKDAKDFVALMQERYQVAPERTYTLYDKDATRKRALQELKNLRGKIGPADSLLVFFSGHGEVEDGQAYWVPADGKPGEEEDWISAFDIKQRLEAINSFHTLLIVDACFSGSFFRSFKAGTRELLGSRRSRLGMSASHSRERALDGRPGENSPFAQELLRALRHNPHPLPTDQLFVQVRDAVMQATEGQQTPIFDNINVKGDDQGQFVFVPAAMEEAAWAAIAALPDATMPEIDAKRSELRRFCLEYADSPHFEIAAELGEDLDYKREFLRKYDSEFGLLRFARKDTPYREAAQKRLAELQAQAAAAPAEPPPPPAVRQAPSQPKPQPQAPQPPADFIFIPDGTFLMGSEEYDDEKPIHEVRVGDFYIGKYAVVVREFQQFIKATNYKTDADRDGGSYMWTGYEWKKKDGVNWACDAAGKPRPDTAYDHPVIHVSWNDAIAYCNWRSEKEGLTKVYTISGDKVTANWNANGYRLPTEAEWEYAARGAEAGAKEGFKYAGSNNLDEVGWYSENSGGQTHPVGQKKPNQLGLYDMSGNVWEWCWDWYDSGYYAKNNNSRDPRGSDSGSYRVSRGGSWSGTPAYARVAYRGYYSPGLRYNLLGFRLARPVK